MRAVYVFIILLNWEILCDEVPPAGHMQPLGSHMPPNEIKVLNEIPNALTFHDSYVKNSLPVKFKGLLKNTDVLKNWRRDEYLREKFGNEVIEVENSKKENRTKKGRATLTVSDFLDKYEKEDIYLVTDLPKSMANEWPLPSFMLCGGYTDNIAFIKAWKSSGNTKSVLHSDLVENLHCVISGTKTFILIDKVHSEDIGSEYTTVGYFDLDVDSVDMVKRPGLAKVPWYKAVIESGDCLYLPYEWIHQVTSTGNNMGINVWWIQFSFNERDCLNRPANTQGFANIGQFHISSEVQIKGFLLDIKREDGTIHATDVLAIQQQRVSTLITIEQLNEAFEILKPGCKGVLHKDQLLGDEIPFAKYKEADNFIGSLIFDESNAQTNDDNGPLIPIIPPGGPPPEELDWEAEIVEDHNFASKDEL